jgi:signal transduction histidine kinase
MYSEQVRREAMQQACDQDMAVLSGRVTLVQETGEDLQAGTLMYVPVYRQDAPHETVAERRAGLLGWVYSPYRMNDLVHEILGHSRHTHDEHIHILLYDVEEDATRTLLFDNNSSLKMSILASGELVRDIPIDAAGRHWLLQCRMSNGQIRHIKLPWLVLGGGVLCSLLLAGLVFSLLNTQFHARRQAAHLTADLRRSEERWKIAIEGAGVGVWDWDVPAGKVLYSRRWKEILGHEEHEIGSSFAEWSGRVFPEDLARALAAVKVCSEGAGTCFSCDYRMRAKDGSLKWIHSSGQVVLRDAAEKTLRMIGTNSDISLSKLHETKMDNLLEEARHLSEMKTRFISVTSHEFRTPMAAAMTSVELLINHADRISAQKIRTLLDRVNLSLRRMAEMLDDVLTLNRIEADRIEVKSEAVELRRLVQVTVDEVRLADRDVHVFECQAPAELNLTTDPDMLYHILSNLLSNAVRYSPAGTVIKVLIESKDGWAWLAIEDKGIGVPDADVLRIFEPFERGSNVGCIKGTGLGLNIVKHMTGLLGGTITVANVQGGGNCFKLGLPLPVAPVASPS